MKRFTLLRWLMTIAAPCSFATAVLTDDIVVRMLSVVAGACYTIVAAGMWVARLRNSNLG
jgi:hypothetical protein